eukprot:Amastigsp_a843456_26.p4 type:complete len:176 gc:universal Amastigsp_a843456_26:628-1155(+)
MYVCSASIISRTRLSAARVAMRYSRSTRASISRVSCGFSRARRPECVMGLEPVSTVVRSRRRSAYVHSRKSSFLSPLESSAANSAALSSALWLMPSRWSVCWKCASEIESRSLCANSSYQRFRTETSSSDMRSKSTGLPSAVSLTATNPRPPPSAASSIAWRKISVLRSHSASPA